MNGVAKIFTAALGIIAVLACLATVGIVGYSLVNKPDENATEVVTDVASAPSAVPTSAPEVNPDETAVPTAVDPTHVHSYIESVVKKATCLEAGQLKYTCACGDSYVVDVLSTGHIPDDWVVVKKATNTEDGYRVRRCIYCDEVISKEILLSTGNGSSGQGDGSSSHQHLYVSTVEREATCVLAGLRKHTCSCGSFYTDSIPALGHVVTDWTAAVEATLTSSGTEQRVCSVCGVVLDVRSVPALTPSPSASSSSSASASASSSGQPSSSASASPSGSASPSASPTPHSHNYVSYVLTAPTCTERGVRSFVCSCGSSYAETIEIDPNNHTFYATFVAPTETQQGYTVYTCVRCNYNYKDNYLMPLTNTGGEDDSSQGN